MTATACDVLVIGAGIAGVSLVRELSRAGMSVLLVDRSSPGGGSTAVAAGGVRTAFSDAINQSFARRTIHQLADLTETSGHDPGFTRVGYLFLVSDPSSLPIFEAMARDRVVMNVPVPDLPSLVPGIETDSLVSAYTTPPLGAGPPPRSAVRERLVQRLLRRLPRLESSTIQRSQAGWLEITPDDNPIVGWFGAENHFVFAGFSGHGLSLAPALAEDAAAVITGRSAISALDAFSPSRFQDHAKRDDLELVALR
jgi:glycine/D-amino acid oxidase-like deaminating enzyme